MVYTHFTSLELLSEALQNFNTLRRVKHMSNRYFILVRVWLFLHAHDFIIHIKLHKLYSRMNICIWNYRTRLTLSI